MRKVIGCVIYKRQMIWTVEENGEIGFSVEHSNGRLLPTIEKAKRLADYQKRVNLIGIIQ